MTDFIRQYLYLVVDRKSNLIISNCSSPSIANAISDGFLNSSVMTIYWPFLTAESNLSNHGYKPQINFKIVKLTKNIALRASEVNVAEPISETKLNLFYDLIEIDSTNLPDGWESKRKLANKRLRLITYLERAIERYMIKHRDFCYSELFYSSIFKEINESRHSDSLKDYSEITGLTIDETVSHITNKLESMSVSVIRMKALWEKYIGHINLFQNDDDDSQILRHIEIELMGGTRKIV